MDKKPKHIIDQMIYANQTVNEVQMKYMNQKLRACMVGLLLIGLAFSFGTQFQYFILYVISLALMLFTFTLSSMISACKPRDNDAVDSK